MSVTGTQAFVQYIAAEPVRLPFKLVFIGGRARRGDGAGASVGPRVGRALNVPLFLCLALT